VAPGLTGVGPIAQHHRPNRFGDPREGLPHDHEPAIHAARGQRRGETAGLPDKRRTLPRWVAFEAMRGLSPVVAVDSGGLRYYVSTRDRSIGRIVYMCGNYDGAVIDAVVAGLDREYGTGHLSGRTVIDVGSNIGTSIIPLVARHGASLGLALEPEPRNVALLRANVAANGLGSRVRVRQVAASDRAGTAVMELSPGNSGDHRIRVGAGTSRAGTQGEARRRTISVPLLPLDDVLAEEGIAPADVGLLWVDTQGHEGQVLAGAATLLAAQVPACVEYWPYGLRRADGLDPLNGIIRASFSRFLDLRRLQGGVPVASPVEHIDRVQDHYPAERYTDLLLLP
jgi:FkbM family methyltransferase